MTKRARSKKGPNIVRTNNILKKCIKNNGFSFISGDGLKETKIMFV